MYLHIYIHIWSHARSYQPLPVLNPELVARLLNNPPKEPNMEEYTRKDMGILHVVLGIFLTSALRGSPGLLLTLLRTSGHPSLPRASKDLESRVAQRARTQ